MIAALFVTDPVERHQAHTLFTALAFTSVALVGWQINIEGLSTRIAPSDAFIALAAVVGLRQLRPHRRTLLWGAATFPLLMGVGLAYPILTGNSLAEKALVRGVGACVLVVAMLVWHAAARQLENGVVRLLRTLVVGVLVTSLVGLIEAEILNTAMLTQQGIVQRFAGALYDANHFGSLAAVCAIIAFELRQRLFPRYPAVGWLLVVAHTAFLGLSLSRGAWVAFIAAVFVLFLLRGRPRIRWKFVAAAAALAIALFASGAVQSALDDFASRPATVGERFTTYENALRDFRESGFVGIGLMESEARHGVIVHNSGLWLLAELGVVGFAWFLAFHAELALRLRSQRQRVNPEIWKAIVGGHVVMTVASLAVEASFQRQWWLIFALTMTVGALRPGTAEIRWPATASLTSHQTAHSRDQERE